eukprot:Opistho-1_new@62940
MQRGAGLGRRSARAAVAAQEAAQQHQRLLLALAPLLVRQLRAEHRLRHLLAQQRALLGREAAVEVFLTLEELVVALFLHLRGAAIEPVLAVVGVVLRVLAFELLQLGLAQAQHEFGAGGLGALGDGEQALADAVGQLAGLGRRHLGARQALGLLQQADDARQLVLAVPGQQLGEFVAHLRGLGAVEVEVAVEPPVAQLGQVVVGELDRAASPQGSGQQQHTDNSGQSSTTNPGRKAHESDSAAEQPGTGRRRHHGGRQGHAHEEQAAQSVASFGRPRLAGPRDRHRRAHRRAPCRGRDGPRRRAGRSRDQGHGRERRRPRFRAPGAPAGHRPCRAAGHAAAAGRWHRGDPVGRRAAHRRGHAAHPHRRQRRRTARAADHRTRRLHGLWPHHPHPCRGRGDGHRRAQGRHRGAARRARDQQRRDGRARAAAQGLAGAPGQQERPGRVLPDRHREVRGRRPRAGGGACHDRHAAGGRHQQPGPARGAGARLAAAPGQRADGTGRAPGRPGAFRPARHAELRRRRRHRRQLRVRRHGVAGRRRAHRRELRHCQRAHRGRRGDPSLHPHRRREGRRDGGRGRAGRALCAAAARCPAGRRGAHRQLRRGQELHAGGRRQGQPPGLPGRRHGGRARELRRGQHHGQLRRRQQAPHRDRGRRARGQQLRARGPRDHRRGRHHRRRLDGEQVDRAGRADRRTGQAGQLRELEAAAEVAEELTAASGSGSGQAPCPEPHQPVSRRTKRITGRAATGAAARAVRRGACTRRCTAVTADTSIHPPCGTQCTSPSPSSVSVMNTVSPSQPGGDTTRARPSASCSQAPASTAVRSDWPGSRTMESGASDRVVIRADLGWMWASS